MFCKSAFCRAQLLLLCCFVREHAPLCVELCSLYCTSATYFLQNMSLLIPRLALSGYLLACVLRSCTAFQSTYPSAPRSKVCLALRHQLTRLKYIALITGQPTHIGMQLCITLCVGRPMQHAFIQRVLVPPQCPPLVFTDLLCSLD